MALLPNIDLEALHRLKEGKPMADNEMHEFFRFFLPKGDQFVTAILVDLNILLFLVMVVAGVPFFSPTADELMAWGACEREAVLNGGYWRLLVSTFEHAGVFHLAMNMVGLFITGMLVEPILGRWRMALAYLFAGICGSVASLVWHENVVSVGASGAIFGLFGVMLSLLLTGIIPKAEKGAYWYILVVYGVVGLLFGFFKSGTDNAAHVGGVLGGFLIGMLFSIVFRKKPIAPNSK